MFRRTSVALALPVLLGLGACSSPSPLCQSVQDLQANFQALRDVNIIDDGVDAVTEQLDAVESSLADVEQEADETFSSDISAVEAAAGQVQSVVDEVEGGTPVGEVATDAVTAVSALGDATQTLVTTAQSQDCDVR